ncbi:MAG: hypothetical protein RJB38_1528 [Pseudomonadota bacterium]|jgi:hypothetical protein
MRAYYAFVWILGAWMALVKTGPGAGHPARQELRGAAPQALREHQDLRAQAILVLEDLIQRERFYQRRTGAYTPFLGKLEFEVPPELRSRLQIQVVEAARDRFLVRAALETPGVRADGAVVWDQIWVNQSFEMQTTFPWAGREGLKGVVLTRIPAMEGSEAPLPELVIERIPEAVSASHF